MQLGHDDTFGAVDDERPGGGHERNLAHVNLLLLDFLDRRLGCFLVHDREAHLGAQRGGKGQTALLTFLHIERGNAELKADKIEARIAGVARDRVDRLERRLQALSLALVRMHVRLQKLRVGIDLRCQQIWHGQHARAFGETLANPLFLGEGISHDISDSRQRRRLASTNRWLTMNGNPLTRPNLSSAVASEDKEKPFSGFSLASLTRS